DLAMSSISARLLERFDYADIRRRRIANYRQLLQELDCRGADLVRSAGITPMFPVLPDGVCPLFFPIVVPDKAAAADALRRPGLDTADVRCLLIDSAWDFTALRPEWNSMLRDSAAVSPFLTWEWLHTWWTHLGGSSQLRMLAVRSGSELVAVAPFRTAAGTA